FSPLQSSTLSDVAARLNATPMQVELAWLLRRAENILLIPGTSSVGDLLGCEVAQPDVTHKALPLKIGQNRQRRFDRPF
ncbi:hypothetical protein ACC862_38105, partial [Rhizobium ruizarguesonis]